MKNEKIILYIVGGIVIVAILTAKAAARTKNSVIDAYGAFIDAAASRFGVPVERIRAHIVVESGGDAAAVGSAGERGLMQLKPGALADSNKVSHDNYTFDDMFNPESNINAGTAYLKWIEKYFFPGDWDKASRAYNQGIASANTPLAFAYLTKIKLTEMA